MSLSMLQFFQNLISNLLTLTGVDMSYLTDKELDQLLLQLVQCGQQDPFHQISDEVKQRIINENIISDQSFTNPPYGCKPGLNKRLLTKWYKAHWELHGTTIAKHNEGTTNDQAYQKYVEWAKREGIPIVPPGPASDEAVENYVNQLARNLQGIGEPAPPRQHPLQQRYGHSVAAEYASTKKKFIIEGIEILADSQEQAMEIFAKQ